MPKLEIGDKEIEYLVSRSNNASRARIDINPSGVRVVIPEGSNLDPHEFITEKRDWVLTHYNEIEEVLENFSEKSFEEGELILFQGEEHKIVYSESDVPKVKEGKIILPREEVNKEGADELLEGLMRGEARKRINEVIEEYNDEIEEDYNKIYIRNQKTKWGSCSKKKNLNFNFRLVMAPPEVLEYVVVHELLHLEEPKHSELFWRRLSEIMPDYQDKREWLKDNKVDMALRREDIY